MIFGVLGKVKRKGNTLIFIDEIQNSPQAIARLRYFYEDRPDLHVIGAGSLLENIVDMKVSFPVGRGSISGGEALLVSRICSSTGQGRHPALP